MVEKSMLAVFTCLPALSKKSKDEKTSDTPIGVINMTVPAPNSDAFRSSVFGLILIPEYQDKGYGTEAFQWAVQWMFDSANLHRLELQVSEGNGEAMALYKKAGFVVEGRKREAKYYGRRYWDVFLTGLLD